MGKQTDNLSKRSGEPNMLAIKNGFVITVTQGVIENGTVLVDGDKIVAIGKDIEIPADAQVIDATGKIVTPGLIDSHSHIALFGDPSIWATADGNEKTGPVQPQLRGMDSFNPDDPAIPEVRAAGVTAVYTGPGSSNIIGGTGFVCKLAGRTADEMIIPGTEGMKMALGENPKRNYADKKGPGTRMGNAAVLREALVKCQNYMAKVERAQAEGKEMPDRDLGMEQLAKVLRREWKARIHAHRADDILTAIRVAEEFNLDYVIEHCTEGYKIADILTKKSVRATVGPLLMGHSKHELWNVSLQNPAVLAKAGMKFSIQVDGSAETKWLGMHAGIAVREGLCRDEAMRAITINAAEIIGVADRMGSLEVGKDADIAIFDDCPLKNTTHCEMTIINGKVVHERRK